MGLGRHIRAALLELESLVAILCSSDSPKLSYDPSKIVATLRHRSRLLADLLSATDAQSSGHGATADALQAAQVLLSTSTDPQPLGSEPFSEPGDAAVGNMVA